MSKKMRSPGQRRRAMIQNIMIVIGIIGFTLAAVIEMPTQKVAMALVAKHEVAVANIVDATATHETVHGRRGRTHTIDVFNISYEFDNHGERHSNVVKVSRSYFDSLANQKTLPVWFDPINPEINQPSFLAQEHASPDPLGNMITVGMFMIPSLLILYYILVILFGREPKGVLPEGFYTTTTWLDVDHRHLVAVDGNLLVDVSIHEKAVGDVQRMYQNNASLDDMINASRGVVTRIPFAAIQSLVSEHFRDSISVDHMVEGKLKSTSLEFLNPTVKAHALERIASHVSDRLEMTRRASSRGAAAGPSLVGVFIVGASMFYFQNIIVLTCLTFALFFFVKNASKRALDPTVTTAWSMPVEPQAHAAR